MKSRIFLHTFCALTNVLMLFIRCRPLSDPERIQAEMVAGTEGEGAESKQSSEATKKPLGTTPSEADMKAAIHQDDSLHHSDEKDDSPEVINSFDLITCGGAALNRMFLTSEEKRQRKAHLYISSASAEDIKKNLIAKFAENKDSEVSSSAYTVRAAVPSVPQVAVEATIKVMSEDFVVHFIEIKRARGDILQYMEICDGLNSDEDVADQRSLKGLVKILDLGL